jgi:Uncharacterized conserved protein (COG2071)
MKIPTLQGVIDRRILINFTIDPDIIAKIIPAPFTPQVYKGKAIVGICLIRLHDIRPKWAPSFLGISSENGAHRIAVEWQENGQKREGVYIPRRDTSSKLNTLVGGRVFPGKHYLAKFNVREGNGNYHVDFTSSDLTSISIDAKETKVFKADSIFETLENASDFFEKGSVGYSPNKKIVEGLKLQTKEWKVSPLEVSAIQSSFFDDESLFPKGSVVFDHALLMTQIKHEWHSVSTKYQNK